ncbi:hypothetical protein BD414DRAFT_480500 [Trametes punicea]|nr:hypothetical protein BD414DRAFT_480500 [Trametes punicea]
MYDDTVQVERQGGAGWQPSAERSWSRDPGCAVSSSECCSWPWASGFLCRQTGVCWALSGPHDANGNPVARLTSTAPLLYISTLDPLRPQPYRPSLLSSATSSTHNSRQVHDPYIAMAAGAAVPGLFFVFAATVLLIFASVSSPTWEDVSFLNVPNGGSVTHFGVFGFTGSSTHIGYYFPGTLGDGRLNGGLFHNLTISLILIPIAAGLSGIAVLFGLCGAGYHRVGTVFMTLTSALAFLVTLVVWVLEMVLFGVARDHMRDRGINATWGNANWLVLGALVSLFLGFFASLCGVFGPYSRRRAAY